MARTLIGNFKGPEGPRGGQGPQGEQGPRGAVGPPGSVKAINTNLISFSPDDWLEKSSYNDSTGNAVDSDSRARLINKIPVNKGESYTLSDYSVYASAIRRVRIYIFDGDNFVRTLFIDRGSTITFNADGDQIGVVLEPIENFSIQKRHINHRNYTMMFKLERGSEPTEMFKAIHENKRTIDDLKNGRTNTTIMISSPARELVGGTQTPLLHYGLQHQNLVNPSDNEEVILSEGLWSFDWVYTMRNHTEGEKCETRVLLNDGEIVRAVNEGNVTNTITTKIQANDGDTLRLTQLVPSGSNFDIHRGSLSYSRMVLYKIGGSLNV